MGTMVCCEMDSVSRLLDDHGETCGCITAYNLLNNCIRTDCSRNVFYQIISHSLNLLVNQYVIRSFSYPASSFVSQRQPASLPVYHISELAIKPVNQSIIRSTIQSCHSIIRLFRNSASYKPVITIRQLKSFTSQEVSRVRKVAIPPLSVLSCFGVLVALSV